MACAWASLVPCHVSTAHQVFQEFQEPFLCLNCVLAIKDAPVPFHRTQLCLCRAPLCPQVRRVLVFEEPSVPKSQVAFTPGRDVWWDQEIPRCSTVCPPQWMASEDRLFLLYTSGSTGKPKGVVHTTGGYM